MKIAIQGHPTRGHEVIQILESLGSKNGYDQSGSNEDFVYFINSVGLIYSVALQMCSNERRIYTLEEFEKEFPFKVGDLCIYYSGFLNTKINVKILGMAIKNDCIVYEVGHKDTTQTHSGIYKRRHTLKPYKEMKEERNITLTLDKAKEWYKKGGELKEIALQAFTKEELAKVDLPKTWEEFCKNYSIKNGECYMGACSEIHISPEFDEGRDVKADRNVCTSQKSAEAHLAMMQLEQLRDCWRQGWKPIEHHTGHCITHYPEGYSIMSFCFISFLSFPTRKMAEEFLNCFRDLIEKAGDLI